MKVDNTRLDKISDHITFTPSPSLADSVNEKTSTLTINPKTLEAGSETPAHILLILQNKQNQPMTGKANHITFDGSELSGDGTDPKISDIKEDENNKGTYTATIKPGTKTGDWRVTLKVDNTRLDKISDHITFTPSPSLADSVNEKTSTLTINPKTLEAGSETPAHILLILQNKQNQPMTGKANHITFDGSELSGDGTDPKISDIKEDENNKGTYTATIKPGTKTGDWRVTLKVDNTRLDKISDNINFEPPLAGRINESKSEFRIASETLEADNQMKTEISLILKDNDSQPITGVQKHIHFEQSELPGNGDKPKISDIQENGSTPGTYTATLTAGTQIGSLTVTPKAGEKALSALAKKVEFTPVPLKISKLKLQVVDQKYLVVGQTLKVDYSIDNNSENGVDNSFYAWGEKGKTAAAVKTLASSGDNGQGNDGTLVTGEVKNGEGVPPYEIQEEHAGKVLEFSILARNGINTRANDIVTLSTDDSKDKGNDTESKIEGGRVANVAELIKITLNPKEGKGDEIKVNGKLVLKLKARTNETKDATSDSAELAVTSIKNGQPVAWVPVKIEMEGFTRDNGNEAVSQDKVTTKLGDAKGPLIDGLYTDGSGQLVKTVSDPEGKGLRTTLNVVADGVNGTTVKDETDIIFTVITSPDVQGASRWGHMEDIVKIKGQFYRRPLLSNEFKRVPASVAEFNSEAWALSTFEEAREKCSSVINSTLVSQSDLKKISGGVLYSRYGWPAKTSALASWDAEGGGVKLRTKQPDYSKGPYTHICLIKNKE
ncbi:putative invasin [Xenorhabdus mauleonii]|uniref:Invasin n=1 Tax=Xenorhabdus mauleonii TaxID=351675 RepID=A0A2G0NY90_9GAMM|nr:putative invasin [Xenorhabdus mauleonii]